MPSGGRNRFPVTSLVNMGNPFVVHTSSYLKQPQWLQLFPAHSCIRTAYTICTLPILCVFQVSALIFLTDLLIRPSQQRHGNSPLAVDRDQPCSDFSAGRHASEGPVLASLLPLAMCLQVSLTLSSTPPHRWTQSSYGWTNASLQSKLAYPYLRILYRYWDLRAAFGGTAKVDRNDRFVLISQCYQS